MKSPARFFIQVVLILVFMYFVQDVYAGIEPPDPGGDPTGGGSPVGGGAPVGNGTIILIAAALTYAAYKLRSIKMNKIKE